MEILLFLLIFPFVRALLNFSDWIFFKKVCEKHQSYSGGVSDNAPLEKKNLSRSASEWITEHNTEIKRRIEKAGIKAPIHSFMDQKGYGYVAQERLSILDNLLYLNSTVQHDVITTLKVTKGYYKNQTLRSINPLFWLEVICYLPKYMVSASGIELSSKLAETSLKVVQVIYWLVIIVAGILNPELLKILVQNFKS